ncbi:phage major capsid protein [Gellertiella hungarica]|uniref:HK97 family phage major capsid protein/HK97 family phage prohead protease n=1 Tax=Gellertiella hungarica TaxID=1572859 RepID=A0A7W6JB23_9HYPH|nr:phage major capsid protein [Gellertiella hungarica]MBB4067173.1 HK97 family phage major capsid protein/HK97 family phage prohead protease [Gellertiella hungarica]
MTDSKSILIKAQAQADDAGTVTGIAWPYGAPDTEGDLIQKGAFAFPCSIAMILEHNPAQPIGVWEEFQDTDNGLLVKGRLFVESLPLARNVHSQLKRGEIGGLSISGSATDFDMRPEGGRIVKAANITEISICKRPVNPGARVTLVKSHLENPMHTETVEYSAEANPAVVSETEVNLLKARMDAMEAKANRIRGVNNNQPEAGNDNDLQKAYASYLRTGEIPMEANGLRKALTVAGDAPKYVLAPKENSRDFIRNLVQFSPVRSIADVRTTSTHTVQLNKRTGVTNATWAGEVTPATASQPAFDQMEIPIREIKTYVDLSNWMIEDSDIDIEAEVRLALAEDFGAKEGLSFVSGSTANEPQGFMTDANIVVSNNGHASILQADAFIKLMYSLPATFRNSGTWVMNGTTLGVVRSIKDTTGNYIWQPGLQAGQPETILGRPVVELVDMPDVAANAFPIAFGDFKSGYRIYDRVELSVMANPYSLAEQGIVRFNARRRVGAGVVRPEAFRKLKIAA